MIFLNVLFEVANLFLAQRANWSNDFVAFMIVVVKSDLVRIDLLAKWTRVALAHVLVKLLDVHEKSMSS